MFPCISKMTIERNLQDKLSCTYNTHKYMTKMILCNCMKFIHDLQLCDSAIAQPYTYIPRDKLTVNRLINYYISSGDV